MKIELNKEELEALIKEALSRGKKVENFKLVWFGDWSRKVEAISCQVEYEEKLEPEFIFFKCPSCGYEYHPRGEAIPENWPNWPNCPNCLGIELEERLDI